MSTQPNRYAVMATYNGRLMRIGVVYQSCGGWRYAPMYQALHSRKVWPTPESAVRGRVKNFTLAAEGEKQ